ncbi:MAG: methyltransferase domain-containing protein [Planctomycetaceae bacterium]|jgi:tRNA (cmo5U34)-methyltransferase|nr:methyltransferase domain-containing protein [Planctomycetaceae bacterium]
MSDLKVEKITMDELRRQFDGDVERFSNEQTGQTSAVDAPLVLELFETLISGMYPSGGRLLDIGCGAGNFSLRIVRKLPQLRLTLLDLSRPMLDRAVERLTAEGFCVEQTIQADVACVELPESRFDVVVAAASLHHLRTQKDWQNVFGMIYRSLVPGGSFWMSDLVRHESVLVEALQKERYANYLVGLRDRDYQQRIFESIDRSDTPETLAFIIRSLEATGFSRIDLIHKNMVFASLAAIKEFDNK